MQSTFYTALSFDWFGSILGHSVWLSSDGSFSFHIIVFFFQISNFFNLSITEETWVDEMHIWCIKIFNVLVLHFNPWVEVSACELLIPKGLYSRVSVLALKYEFELSKKVNCVYSSPNEGLLYQV
jgi:hypothetical protein